MNITNKLEEIITIDFIEENPELVANLIEILLEEREKNKKYINKLHEMNLLLSSINESSK